MAGNKSGNFWLAVFSLVGATIGAGIFGLPYVFFKSGFLIGTFELAMLGGIIILIQLMAGEIALRTRGKKRLIGYAEEYLSAGWRYTLTVSIIFSGIGSLLAYLVLAGGFLSSIFGLNVFSGTIIFFIVWFALLLLNIKSFGKIELFFGLSAIILIILIAVFNIGYIDINNFLNFNFHNILLPYGIILFAISGTSMIPGMEDLLENDKSKFKKAIIIGTLIPILTYLLFVVTVMGISGDLTSFDAISGLAKTLNSHLILILGSLVGLLATFGAAFSFGIYFRDTLWYDLGIKRSFAWFLTGILPILLFLLGTRNFIDIIGIIGSVFLGFQLIMILWMHKNSKLSGPRPIYEINLPRSAYWILGILMTAGALLELLSL